MNKFAVIDIETNWNDEVMSIGFDGGKACVINRRQGTILCVWLRIANIIGLYQILLTAIKLEN